jgi:hypothetical protein
VAPVDFLSGLLMAHRSMSLGTDEELSGSLSELLMVCRSAGGAADKEPDRPVDDDDGSDSHLLPAKVRNFNYDQLSCR